MWKLQTELLKHSSFKLFKSELYLFPVTGSSIIPFARCLKSDTSKLEDLSSLCFQSAIGNCSSLHHINKLILIVCTQCYSHRALIIHFQLRTMNEHVSALRHWEERERWKCNKSHFTVINETKHWQRTPRRLQHNKRERSKLKIGRPSSLMYGLCGLNQLFLFHNAADLFGSASCWRKKWNSSDKKRREHTQTIHTALRNRDMEMKVCILLFSTRVRAASPRQWIALVSYARLCFVFTGKTRFAFVILITGERDDAWKD